MDNKKFQKNMNIKNYKSFVNESNKFKITEQIEFLEDHVKGYWNLNDEGVVDVDGDFDCFNKGISNLIIKQF